MDRTQIIQNQLKGRVAQYKTATKKLLATGFYVRGRPGIKPLDGGTPYYVDVYTLQGNEVVLIAYNLSPHRLDSVIKGWKMGFQYKYPEIWQNYVTNGYSTRLGLFRSVGRVDTKRLGDIAQSHANFLGQETGDSTTDHEARVRLRN